jgi:hypothetical protein
MAKTISGSVYKTVTLGVGGYTSPLNIAAAGRIVPPGYGQVGIIVPLQGALAGIINRGDVFGATGAYGHAAGAGGNAVDLNSATSLNNLGVIEAGGGGDSNYFGGNGGIGIDVQSRSTVLNSGEIFGGFGNYGFYTPGTGGAGIVLASAATVNNIGVIQGGGGGNTQTYNAVAYEYVNGGVGLSAGYEALVNNTGHITGGGGGIADQDRTYYGVGFAGAAGVTLGTGSSITNSGTITGGGGGGDGTSDMFTGGSGGYGLMLAGAFATNTGAIAGGAGAYGLSDGGSGGRGVVLGNYGTLNNKATITGGAGGASNARYGGNGGGGLLVYAYATATNNGHITGGAGGIGGNEAAFGDGGGAGGYGAYLASGKLTNNGTITGGNGGNEPGNANNNMMHHDNGGPGGTGVVTGAYGLSGQLNMLNYGVILGGSGGNLTQGEGTAGSGGYGVMVNYGMLTNDGTVIGGAGGYVYDAAGYIVGGVGGAGVAIRQGTTVVNAGTIIGGTGGSTVFAGSTGGAGVFIMGGTFIDSGLVSGGAGGISHGAAGAMGDAVYLAGSIGGTLIVDPGATFAGNVVAQTHQYQYPPVENEIELAGSSSVALSGFGTDITGFNEISFASGAVRTIEGSFSGTTAIQGFTTNDTIVIDGFAASVALTSIASPVLELTGTAGFEYLDLSLAKAKDLIITASTSKDNTTIVAAAGNVAHTIGGQMQDLVAAGGTATSSFLKGGGHETILQGGTAANTTIAGGTLQLNVGAVVAGTISFDSIVGGKLTIASATMPTATITSFVSGDSIKLAGIVYNSADKVSVGSAGVVTIAGPGTNVLLHIAGATVGETDFTFSSASVLTRGAPAAPKTVLPMNATLDLARLFGANPGLALDLAPAALVPAHELVEKTHFGVFTTFPETENTPVDWRHYTSK